MQVEIKIDSSYTEPKIIILTNAMTEEIHDIVKKLSENVPLIISGSKDQKVEVLEETDLIKPTLKISIKTLEPQKIILWSLILKLMT